MEDLLKVSNLNTEFKSDYGSKPALNNISFNIKEGEVLALVGESGSGKTVTSLSIMGLLPNNASVENGEIKLLSKKNKEINILNLSDEKHNEIRGNDISMVFQEPMTCLNPTMTVGEQILEVIIRHKKISKINAKKEMIGLLELVEIPDPIQRSIEYPHQLSGGMRQRIMIAIALACSPKLIIADEPTSALDVTIQAQLLELLKKLKNSIVTKTSILFITHDLGIVKELADRVIVMYQGKIVEEGNVLDVFENPKHSYTNNLIQSLPEFKIEKRKQNKIIKKETNNKNIILSIKNLYKEFPVDKGIFKQSSESVKAVQNVSLNVRQNKILGLVGESGSGKSTLGKTIIKLIEPTSGKINFKNQDISNFNRQKMQNIRQKIQMIFQDPFASLNPRKNILDTLMEPILVHKLMKKNEATEYIKQIIHDVGLPIESLIRFPHEFSGGQRQRIGIARALVLKPEFIIADEPVSALDVSIQAQVLNLLETIKETYNLTMIFISHDLSVIEYFCDEVAVMYLGHIVEMAPVNELFSNPKHSYTKALLSAVPKVKAKKTNKILIKGDIPSPINPPSGCVFRTRCPNPTHDCKEGNIQMGLIEVSPNHWVDQCCVNCH
ncbi:MAG: Glutathione import ATP-binding protein GsiA [Alphaproteobacteria bacterium MarineAlpha5_Bin12]|nr:MAG: Glutathione import ATP-binding protein GsiA [Alphaproteobacteria bacterium MarineAlpha5_Bin12]